MRIRFRLWTSALSQIMHFILPVPFWTCDDHENVRCQIWQRFHFTLWTATIRLHKSALPNSLHGNMLSKCGFKRVLKGRLGHCLYLGWVGLGLEFGASTILLTKHFLSDFRGKLFLGCSSSNKYIDSGACPTWLNCIMIARTCKSTH